MANISRILRRCWRFFFFFNNNKKMFCNFSLCTRPETSIHTYFDRKDTKVKYNQSQSLFCTIWVQSPSLSSFLPTHIVVRHRTYLASTGAATCPCVVSCVVADSTDNAIQELFEEIYFKSCEKKVNNFTSKRNAKRCSKCARLLKHMWIEVVADDNQHYSRPCIHLHTASINIMLCDVKICFFL